MSSLGATVHVLRFSSRPVSPGKSLRIDRMIEAAVKGLEPNVVRCDVSKMNGLKNKRIIVAIDADEIGGQKELYDWLRRLSQDYQASGCPPLSGSTACVLVNSDGPYYTKRLAQYAIFHMNRFGCRFLGHPLVEAVADLQNFKTWKKVVDIPLEKLLEAKCSELGVRLRDFKVAGIKKPKILVLHSSSHDTSNTLRLWSMVAEHLEGFEMKEHRIEDDKIAECKGCSFKTCMHYSEMKSCYYGGMMVEQILPAMEWADAVIWVCPNYNDAISAKLMAVINRMTVLYRRITFYDKRLFGIIVSGNSGSDLVMTQLLGAVNINKGYMLPPQFGFSAIANDPGSIEQATNIHKRAKAFADNIKAEFALDLVIL